MPETSYSFSTKPTPEMAAEFAKIGARHTEKIRSIAREEIEKAAVGFNDWDSDLRTPLTAPTPPHIADALNRIEEGYRELLSTLPAIREGLDGIADLDYTAGQYGTLFVNRLLTLAGSTERVRGPATTPAPKPAPAPEELAAATAERRLRTIQRTRDRLFKARQTERAAGDIADKLQAVLAYAVRNTEPVDAYDLSNEERKTEDELKTLETQIDRFRDTEARAAARAETAERVLVEMGAWPKAVG